MRKTGAFCKTLTEKAIETASNLSQKNACVITCQSNALTNILFCTRAPRNGNQDARERRMRERENRTFYGNTKQSLKLPQNVRKKTRVSRSTKVSNTLTNTYFFSHALSHTIQRTCVRAPKARARKIGIRMGTLRKKSLKITLKHAHGMRLSRRAQMTLSRVYVLRALPRIISVLRRCARAPRTRARKLDVLRIL